jgi:outer membrane protein assembly factor BamB
LAGYPLVINGQPVVSTSSGTIYMLDGATGTQLWSDKVGTHVNSMNAGDGQLAISADTGVTVHGPDNPTR